MMDKDLFADLVTSLKQAGQTARSKPTGPAAAPRHATPQTRHWGGITGGGTPF
jgi:hypothetical protein